MVVAVEWEEVSMVSRLEASQVVSVCSLMVALRKCLETRLVAVVLVAAAVLVDSGKAEIGDVHTVLAELAVAKLVGNVYAIRAKYVRTSDATLCRNARVDNRT